MFSSNDYLEMLPEKVLPSLEMTLKLMMVNFVGMKLPVTKVRHCSKPAAPYVVEFRGSRFRETSVSVAIGGNCALNSNVALDIFPIFFL